MKKKYHFTVFNMMIAVCKEQSMVVFKF